MNQKLKLKLKSLIYKNPLFKFIKIPIFMNRMYKWYLQGSPPPSPHFIKQTILKRHSIYDACWVETGTNKGDTTSFLANFAQHVYTVEP